MNLRSLFGLGLVCFAGAPILKHLFSQRTMDGIPPEPVRPRLSRPFGVVASRHSRTVPVGDSISPNDTVKIVSSSSSFTLSTPRPPYTWDIPSSP